MEASLNQTLLIYCHVITQIIETKLIVSNICNIGIICFLSFLCSEVMHYSTYSKSQESMHITHPLSITVSQVIVNCYDMNSLSFKGIQICRHGRHKGFTFTCTHLCQTSLMKDDTTHYLNRERLKAYGTVCRFSYSSKCIHENVIQSFSICQTLFENICSGSELFIRESLHLLVKCKYLIYKRFYFFQLSVTVCTE